MIRRLRDPFGGRASREAVDAAVARGMADVLAALDNVVDDDAALARIYAARATSRSIEASSRLAGTTAGQGSGLGSGHRRRPSAQDCDIPSAAGAALGCRSGGGARRSRRRPPSCRGAWCPAHRHRRAGGRVPLMS